MGRLRPPWTPPPSSQKRRRGGGVRRGDNDDAKGVGPACPRLSIGPDGGGIIQATSRYRTKIGSVARGATLPPESALSDSEQPEVPFGFYIGGIGGTS